MTSDEGEQAIHHGRVLDLYCGRGGVGRALCDQGLAPIGVDREPYGDDYPGEFIRGDATSPPVSGSFDLVWASPPCTAYSCMTGVHYDNPKEHYPTIPELNVKDVCASLGEHYIIENVRTCDDLDDPVKLNGKAFSLPFNQERWFETSFPVPDCFSSEGVSDIPIGGRGNRSSDVDQSSRKQRMARVKGVPETWDETSVIAAIPSQYVEYLLHYCPSTPDVPPPDELSDKQSTLTEAQA